MHRRASRLIANGLILLGLLVGISGFVPVGAGGPGVAHADAGRAVTLSQATDLINQVVTVSWSGFRPTLSNGNFNTIILQCKVNPTSLADCYTANPYPDPADGNRVLGITDSSGSGSVSFEVRPAANLPQLNCSRTNPCSIMVYENDGVDFGSGLPSTATFAQLDFAPSIADCPPVTNFDVRLDGSASAAQLFYRWAAGKCVGANKIVIDYTTTSDTSGRENFLAGLVDSGVTGVEVSAEELESHPDHREFVYAPVSLTAVVMAFNMRDASTGAPIKSEVTNKNTSLKMPTISMSQRLVATMVTDSGVTGLFSDLEFRRLNSQRDVVPAEKVNLPNVGIEYPLLRAELCADTRILTGWMAANADAQKFLQDQDIYGRRLNPAYVGMSYPRDNFENVAQSSFFLPRLGEEIVAKKLFYGTPPSLTTQVNTKERGLLGVLDLPTAKRFGLGLIGVKNGAGEFVLPNAASVLAGFNSMKVQASGVRVNDYAATTPGAYPLVKIDYALVPVSGISKVRARSLVSMLEYSIGAGQQALPVGYFPLPEALKAQTRSAIAALKAKIINVAPSTTTTEAPAPTYTVPPTVPVDTTLPPVETTVAPPAPDPISQLPSGSPAVMFPVVLVGAFISGVGVLSRNRLPETKK